MKIGLVCPYNIFKGGGVQECVLALRAGLEARGHEAYIITPQPRDYPEEIPDHVLFVGLSADINSFHTTTQISVSINPEQAQNILDDYNFDVLHFHEPWVPIMSRQLLAKSQSVNIATFHAKLPETVMSRTVERVVTPYTKSVLKYLNVLTAVSDSAAEYVGQLTKAKIEIIPNGIDLKKYTPSRKLADKPIVLYVGRLEKRKGVKHLLDAFALLQQSMPEAELWIVGDGVERSKLESRALQLDLSNVTFHGYVSEKDKLKIMQKAQVFCSPARYGESFGIVLLEAMAMGLPTVAGDNPGYASVMKEKGLMSLVDPLNHADLARRLELFLSDAELRNMWRTWAMSYVKQFDYEHVIDSYVEVYDTAVKKGS